MISIKKIVACSLFFLPWSISAAMLSVHELVATKDTYNKMLLASAAKSDHKKVGFALDNGADLEATFSLSLEPKDGGIQEVSPIDVAVISNSLPIARLLLDRGADVTKKLQREMYRLTLFFGLLGDISRYEFLPKINFALSQNRIDIARLLYLYGAPSSDNSRFLTEPLLCAAISEDQRLAQMLKANPLPSESELQQALAFAAGRNRLSNVQQLLQVPANPISAYSVVTGILRRKNLAASEKTSYQQIYNLLRAPALKSILEVLHAEDTSRVKLLPKELQAELVSFMMNKKIA